MFNNFDLISCISVIWLCTNLVLRILMLKFYNDINDMVDFVSEWLEMFDLVIGLENLKFILINFGARFAN
jgi:hypothetical protein